MVNLKIKKDLPKNERNKNEFKFFFGQNNPFYNKLQENSI